MSPIDQRLQAVFREFFRNDSIALTDATTFSDIEGWDSVAHVNLINTLEEEFGVKFGVRELMKMTNVAGIKQVLTAKTAAL